MIGIFLSVKISIKSVMIDSNKISKKTGMIPGHYLILMYNMKKLLQAISEALHHTDGWTSGWIHSGTRLIPRSPSTKGPSKV